MGNYKVSEFKFVIIEYKENDISNIKELGDYIDTCAPDILRFFEIDTLPEKAHIVIIPTKKEFDEIFNQKHGHKEDSKVKNWIIGFAGPYDSSIVYLSINDYGNTSHKFDKKHAQEAYEEYKKTLVHEFIHFVNNYIFNKKHNCGKTVKYLSEGIATYLSKQNENKKIKFEFDIDEILWVDKSKSCYNGWYLVTKYLIENYEKNFIFSLFESSREAEEFLKSELFEKAKGFYKINN